MTKNKIENLMVDNIVRLYSLTGYYTDEPTLRLKKDLVVSKLSTLDGCSDIRDFITSVINDIENFKSVIQFYTVDFLKLLRTLLEIRISSGKLNVIELEEVDSLSSQEYNRIKDMLNKRTGYKTLVSYSVLEQAGSKELLAKQLRKNLDLSVEIEICKATPKDKREKTKYMNRSILMLSPILPAVIVRSKS